MNAVQTIIGIVTQYVHERHPTLTTKQHNHVNEWHHTATLVIPTGNFIDSLLIQFNSDRVRYTTRLGNPCSEVFLDRELQARIDRATVERTYYYSDPEFPHNLLDQIELAITCHR